MHETPLNGVLIYFLFLVSKDRSLSSDLFVECGFASVVVAADEEIECRGVACGLKIVVRRREDYIGELKALGDCEGATETMRFMEEMQQGDMNKYDRLLLLINEIEAKAREKSRFILNLSGYEVD
nr:hypothetical protein [Tanacetum cinerariifolium]